MTLPTPAAREDDPPAYVYIVECGDGTLYTGWTLDLAARVAAHNAGRGGRYTRSRRPVRLVYWEAAPDRAEAMRREAALKRLRRSAKLALSGGGNPLAPGGRGGRG